MLAQGQMLERFMNGLEEAKRANEETKNTNIYLVEGFQRAEARAEEEKAKAAVDRQEFK